MLSWTLDGSILFSRKLPGSKVPWEYQTNRPDTDHYNRDYKPELAAGGTEICRLNPATGKTTRLSAGGPGVWDCRATESPDAQQIVFCRAETGHMPGLWSMKPNGTEARLLTLPSPNTVPTIRDGFHSGSRNRAHSGPIKDRKPASLRDSESKCRSQTINVAQRQ